MKTSRRIREEFLDFFRERGHEIVPSSPVVPLDDPTLMFANAGMNQFKDVFLGTGTRPYVRAADTQKCIRAGGKHNDLDDVGQDTYHQTFFEMLGNWSFGDYFKKEAIQWAWELLTGVWGIEKDRLHATYFEGDQDDGLEPDEEAKKLWRSVTDINPENIHPGSKKDNFWEMGETGPCGPCSEIHIDLTPDKSGRSLVNAGDPNVIELWNLVFIQFNRGVDGALTPLPAKHVDTGMGFERLCAVLNGRKSNYDTDVFGPLFEAIQERTGAPDYKGTLPGDERRDEARDGGTEGRRDEGRHGGTKARRHEGGDEGPAGQGDGGIALAQVMVDVSYRVIADHVRCLTFALADGAVPSNEGRGYVLRRILRRAVRCGRQYLGMEEPFLCDLVDPLVAHMSDVFPELKERPEHVKEIIRDEEASFLGTIDRGIRFWWHATLRAVCRVLKPECSLYPVVREGEGPHAAPVTARDIERSDLSDSFLLMDPNVAGMRRLSYGEHTYTVVKDYVFRRPTLSGGDAFKLHDTYGFPIDLTEQMAHERGLDVDIAEYERLMESARETARRGLKSDEEAIFFGILKRVRGETTFVGYDTLCVDSPISTILVADSKGEPQEVRSLFPGQEAWLILSKTPFYPEQGGQVGDVGEIVAHDGSWEFEVDNTLKVGETILHHGHCVRGPIQIDLPSAGLTGGGSTTVARTAVTESRRRATMKNHSATHMLNWALREVLGEHVQQKGSLVDPEKTRFDFSHNKPLRREELERVESLVNELIGKQLPVHTKVAEQGKAREINTLRAVFGEKYPDEVRVVSMGANIDEMLAEPKDPQWMAYPVEFCGGTHLRNTAEAEKFVLIAEEAVAKGIRRVVGITGEAAREAAARGEALAAEIARTKEAGPEAVAANVGDLQREVDESVIPVAVAIRLRGEITALQKIAKRHSKEQAGKAADDVMSAARSLLGEADVVGGTHVIVGEVPQAPADALRTAIDWFRQKTDSSAALLACREGDKVTLVAGMSRDAVEKGLKAGDLIREAAPLVGGKGGGRPDLAQGGGGDPSGIPAALERARSWLGERLG